MITLQVTEEDRQAIIMALAHLAVERPGWDDYLQRIAIGLSGTKMYVDLKLLHEESIAQLRPR